MPYDLTPRAAREFQAILDNVELHSGPERADALEAQLLAAFDLLGRNPGFGQLRPDLYDGPAFFYPSPPYMIVFRRYELPTQIVAFYHTAREARRLLKNLDV